MSSPNIRKAGPAASKIPSTPVAALIASGQFSDAVALATSALRTAPNDAALLHLLGIAKERTGDHTGALQALQAARTLTPKDASLHNQLGIVFESLEDFDAAIRAYHEALRLNPKQAEAHSNLASLLIKQEKPREALEHARSALRIQKDNPLTLIALGDALDGIGETQAAIGAYEEALRLKTSSRRVYTSLARLLIADQRPEKAVEVLELGRRNVGDEPLLLNDLALTLAVQGKVAEAQPLFEAAYKQLDDSNILHNVIRNLARQELWGQVFALESEVLRHGQPNAALPPLFSAAVTCNNWDLQEKLLAPFVEWCETEETKLDIAVTYAIHLLSHPTIDPAVIAGILKKSANRFGKVLAAKRPAFDFKPALEQREKLRIGYLSGDFRFHVVNHHVSGQFSHYDKQYFEVYCYSNLDEAEEDDITAQYRTATDRFVNVSKMSALELAKMIHDDGVHILIDLSGYTGKSILGVTALRPAPIQMSYLGFPFTTGMEQVDYYLCDKYLNGKANAGLFSEKLLEIRESYVTGGTLAINPNRFDAPVGRSGYVTYGSLNNPYKLNRHVIEAWSKVLQGTAGARLILNHPRYSNDQSRENVTAEFRRNGVDVSRVSFVTECKPPGLHLAFYDDIDVCLDTFPLTGGTTTYESLWMGVPVVTCVGDVNYQRLSYSLLKNCGIDAEELIGFSEEEFVAKAIALGNNPQRIAALHDAIGRNMRQSILCDPARQVRFYEDALIDAWNEKFPEQPRFSPETFAYTRLNTPSRPTVATTPMPGNLHHYVVQEQGRWFAPEYAMLEKLAQCLGGVAVEIGTEPGFFTLELAHAGIEAVSLCASAVASRQTMLAAEVGGVIDRVAVRLESARTNLLDRAELNGVTLLRIGVEANSGDAGPVVKNPGFWAANAPVTLVSVHRGEKPDFTTAERLAEMGYRLYRMLPGAACFVPYVLGEPLDVYALYLLACPPNREAALERAAIVVRAATPIPAGMTELAAKEVAADVWKELDAWVVRCAALAAEDQRTPAERLGYLEAALQAQLMIVGEAPSTTRRITLARLLAEYGRRAEATSLFNQALGEFEAGTARLTEPFLAPSATWDSIADGGRVAEWLLAGVLETRCRLAAHSSFFLPEGDVTAVLAVATLGFRTAFIAGIHRARPAAPEIHLQA